MSLSLGIFIVSFLVLLFAGLPVAWTMVASSILWLVAGGQMAFLPVLPERIFQGTDVFVPMATPQLILAGELIDEGRITERLIAFANVLFGWMPGGLAQVNIGASILFSGITGVAPSDIAALLYRTLGVAQFLSVLSRSAVFSSQLLIIVGCGAIFTWVMGMENVPSLVESAVDRLAVPPVTLLLTLNLIMLVLGMFIDPVAAIILFIPILGTAAAAAGVDPVHIGAIAILNLKIGLLTPPLGVCLFAAERIAGCGLPALLRETWPFLAVSLVALVLVTYVPGLSLWLPRLLGF